MPSCPSQCFDLLEPRLNLNSFENIIRVQVTPAGHGELITGRGTFRKHVHMVGGVLFGSWTIILGDIL